MGGHWWRDLADRGYLRHASPDRHHTDCVNGAQQDHAWFEELPQHAERLKELQRIPRLLRRLNRGDRLPGDLRRLGNEGRRPHERRVGCHGHRRGLGSRVDTGNGQFPSRAQPLLSRMAVATSAEWIVEDYGQGASPETAVLVPLANFGTVAFTDLTTSLSSWSLPAADSVAIFKGGSVISQPSSVSNNGFSVSYTGP